MLKRMMSMALIFILVFTSIGFSGGSSAYSSYTIDEVTYEMDSSGCIYSFSGNTTEINIPEKIGGITVQKIDEEAFNGSLNTEEIHIPSTVTGTGWCKNIYVLKKLKEITVDAANQYVSMVDGVIYSKDLARLMYYPRYLTAETFVFPESVTSIADHAFENNTYLKNVVMNNNITSLSRYCFFLCSSLSSIQFSSALKEISQACFFSCGFTSIDIPAGVTTLGSNCFRCCSELETATIPASVRDMDKTSFGGTEKLKSISIDNSNEVYCSIDDVILTKDRKELLYYPSGKTATAYSIPDGVEVIDSSAFDCWCMLEDIVLPSSMKTIGENIFSSCIYIESITIPDSVTEIKGDLLHAEASSSNLPNATIKCSDSSYAKQYAIEKEYSYEIIESTQQDDPYTIDGVKYEINDEGLITSISSDAVIVDIPTSINGTNVTGIHKAALDYHSSLEKLHIPACVTCQYNWGNDNRLDNWWEYLYNCSSLKEVTVDSGNTSVKMVNGVLYSYDGTRLLYYPSYLTAESYEIADGVTDIGKSAVRNNEYLKEIKMPDTVTRVWEQAVTFLNALESVKLSTALDVMGESNFNSCSSLKSFAFPEGIRIIGQNVLNDCNLLETISIPKTLTSIGSSLSSKSCQMAKDNSKSLKQYIVDADNPKFKSVDGCLLTKDGKEFIHYPQGKQEKTFAVPYGVETLYKLCFGSSAIALKNIVLPDTMTKISDGNISYLRSLESVTIPDSVIEIEGKLLKNSPKAVIRCGEDSYAMQYAIDNGYTYELVDSDKKEQHITGVSDVVKYISDPAFTICPLNDGDGELTYETDSDCVTLLATENGIKITPVSAGTATITVKAKGTAEYLSAEKKFKVTIYKDVQEITCDKVISKTYGEGDFKLSATALGEVPLSYSSSDDCIELSSKGEVKLIKAGKAKISIKAEETAEYQSGELEIEINVAKGKQTIESKESFITSLGSSSFYLGVKTYGNGEVTYSSSSDCISVSIDGEVSINNAGEAEVTVAMAETPQYEACSKVIKVTVEGHEHSAKKAEKENVVESTCEKSGSYELVVRCSSCGEKLASEKVITAPLGHETVTDKAVTATYTSEGKTSGEHCSRCSKVIAAQKKVPMLSLKATSKVAVSLKTYNTARITWSKVKGATGYYVMYRKGSSGNWTVKKTSKLSYTTGTLKAGYLYQFKIKAYAKNDKDVIVNKSDNSAVKSCRMLKKMNRPKVVKTGAAKAKVSWEKCSGVSGYQVCVIPKSTNKSLMVNTTSLSKTLSPVTKGNSYTFKVRAYMTVNGNRIYAPWSNSITYKHK